jgi:cell wall-associated NlpC family hydrolase
VETSRQRFLRGTTLRPSSEAEANALANLGEQKTNLESTTVSAPAPSAGFSQAEETPEATYVALTPETVAEEEKKPTPKPTPAKTDAAIAARAALATRSANVVRSALSYRGVPYRMGATGRGAFDCSAFVRHVFARQGKYLPRTAAEQYGATKRINKAEMRPGDLVFFRNTYKNGISHVGIYIGNNQFIHASSGGGQVKVDSLSSSYYVRHWGGARRVD